MYHKIETEKILRSWIIYGNVVLHRYYTIQFKNKYLNSNIRSSNCLIPYRPVLSTVISLPFQKSTKRLGNPPPVVWQRKIWHWIGSNHVLIGSIVGDGQFQNCVEKSTVFQQYPIKYFSSMYLLSCETFFKGSYMYITLTIILWISNLLLTDCVFFEPYSAACNSDN